MNFKAVLVLSLTWYGLVWASAPCSPRDYGQGSVVCVCNETYCDYHDPIADRIPSQGDGFLTLTTSKSGQRFEEQLELTDQSQFDSEADLDIYLDSNKTYQEIIGFGGALTDSAAINILRFGNLSERILSDYFGANGLEYSIARVPIGGSDASTRPYSLDDHDEDDMELTKWSLAPEDKEIKIPVIRKAQEIAHRRIKLIGTPWSAPGWMKANNNFTGGAEIKGKPGGPYYKAFANYIVKFLKAYRDIGLEFWGMTVINEPEAGYFPVDGLIAVGMHPDIMKEFVKYDLGPALHTANFTSGAFNLIIHDDNIDEVERYANEILSDPKAAEFVSGIGFHWYIHYSEVDPQTLDGIHARFPSKFILSTEACNGFQDHSLSLGNWTRAELYADYIMYDLNHYVGGWVDWSMVLDTEGGPNWQENFVDASIIVNASTKEYYKQPTYYILGHFSKLLPPGSKRIDHKVKIRSLNAVDIKLTTFLSPHGNKVIIALNVGSFKVKIKIHDPVSGTLSSSIPPHSIKSYVYR